MEKHFIQILLTLFGISGSLPALALEFEVDGIRYVSDRAGSAYVTKKSEHYQGDIVIPSTVTYSSKEYIVEGIGLYAFWGCSSLTSVTIPSTVTNIGYDTFNTCSSLTNINVDSENKSFKSIDGILYDYDVTKLIVCPAAATRIFIPNTVAIIGESAFLDCALLQSIIIPGSVTSIGRHAFSGCSELTTITIPETVTSIGNGAFFGCSALTSITIPNTVTSIGEHAFYGCSALATITIPETVTSIGVYAFSGCSALAAITIPDSVTSIGDGAFYGCSALQTLTIPKSVTSLGKHAFRNSAPVVIIKSKQFDSFKSQEAIDTIVAHSTILDRYSYLISAKNKYNYDYPILQNYKSYYFRIDINFNPYFDGTDRPFSISYNNNPLTLADGIYRIENLRPDTEYKIDVAYTDEDGMLQNSGRIYRTRSPYCEAEPYATQTTVTFRKIYLSTDETVVTKGNFGFTYNGEDYGNGRPLKITGLAPESKGSIIPYAYYNGEKIIFKPISFLTKSLRLDADAVAGPTSVRLNGSVDAGDAEIDTTGWTEMQGDRVVVTGLAPESEYTFTYNATTKNPAKTFRKTVNVTTDRLELTTLAPKCVSSSCAIVAAQTNMSEYETGAGFQWKKYDAPASLAPSEAFAAVCDGHLEGRIHNLQSTSYYNVRAFYKDATGKYVYGDWVTFDPSDFSFFEPTVHTYPVQSVATSSATLRGYALAGSDDITSQGFEYWPTAPAAVQGMHRKAPAAGVTTVECPGQVMRVVITDLKPGTEYTFRSFVVTDKGTTYGEEQLFTTEGEPESAIEEISEAEVTVIGYFDLKGNRYDKPCRGINIVKYSDGSCRKKYMR